MIKRLHHAAYRCRDSEETRKFYEDFLGLSYIHAVVIEKTKTERPTRVLHTFYAMQDGSCLAFFEQPGEPFEFKPQHDYDLHIALEVDRPVLESMFNKGKDAGIETRGIIDHEFIWSIYFRDPNGYVVELTAKQPDYDKHVAPVLNGARQKLADWQAGKSSVLWATAAKASQVGKILTASGYEPCADGGSGWRKALPDGTYVLMACGNDGLSGAVTDLETSVWDVGLFRDDGRYIKDGTIGLHAAIRWCDHALSVCDMVL